MEVCVVGEVHRVEDVVNRKKMMRKALQDLSPDLRRTAESLFERYSGEDLENRLVKLLGEEKARKLLRFPRK